MARRSSLSTLELSLFPQPTSAQANQYWYVTQRPWPSLLFILPGLLLFEIGTICHDGWDGRGNSQLVAPFLIERLVESLRTGDQTPQLLWMGPGLLLIAFLLAWHIAARHPWRFDGFVLAGMLGESLLHTIPLVVFGRLMLQAARPGQNHALWLDSVIRSFGAGIYEELVFRLICITVLVILLIDLARLPRGPAGIFILAASAVLFAYQHHPPLGAEPFAIQSFLFRSAAGLYLAGLFVFRGFGIAAGCHVFYNVIVVTMGAISHPGG
ncbi:MAG TPA: CPBP family intramembrane metalloprotease [Phycisphaerae bacterium]|jgi:hypothetical protein|nr:CPBP family intramembrane metalloprotease [Phycisphaerae bacterium]HOB73313.1 CPBP family intramembrane metalloprotease [Phycisphaerae bacterium]HOJ55705.1 CPBP family intramembrane metalloprotease [Phycisphaerae bacterium]HOL26132.1 CPBP family intramembrane metalloprotease [Phycisphaerae bacterium]HPP22048.1 CPBP family intramembrane metalloprotease [Phycisphaerae bacterium]